MGDDTNKSDQQDNPQSDDNTQNTGSGLPEPDPDLSDYYRRDGNIDSVIKR